ncbi:D-ribose pyranase [Cohnella phaseoli]|uniref:D-ribose pyranase n=1 Tax=Cohnella phaseoli TaxID=456490 RepID=A0A3D9IC69_9BACL|nr:D-ribose pyranase [Cohnella phaseoli]RED59139.1 D-ribose pyranase [Cohnella phaseoli]
MKKTPLLNPDISRVIASMGHYQTLVVCDAGFPIPEGVERIDLALTPGMAPFLDVLRTVLSELCVEEVIVARETLDVSPDRYAEMIEALPGIEAKVVPHTSFKELSHSARAVIRSGECMPYSNIMLVSGVTYGD